MRRVLGHSFVRSLVPSHHSLVCWLRTARFARAQHCAHLFASSSLTPGLMGKCMIRCLITIWLCSTAAAPSSSASVDASVSSTTTSEGANPAEGDEESSCSAEATPEKSVSPKPTFYVPAKPVYPPRPDTVTFEAAAFTLVMRRTADEFRTAMKSVSQHGD